MLTTTTRRLKGPEAPIEQPTKERELVYLIVLLARLNLPLTVRRAQAVLQNSSGHWQLTSQEIAEMWPWAKTKETIPFPGPRRLLQALRGPIGPALPGGGQLWGEEAA